MDSQHLKEEIETLKKLRNHDKKVKLEITAAMLSTLNRGDIQNLKKEHPDLMGFIKQVLTE